MEIYIAIFFFFILTVAMISFTEKLRQKEYREKESWPYETRRRDGAKHWPW